MINILRKIYVFFIIKYQEYKGKKGYANKSEQYISIISPDVLLTMSNDDLIKLQERYFAIRAKGLDDNLYYDCENGDVYAIIDNYRYNLLDMVSYRFYGYDLDGYELENVPFARVLNMDISLDLNPGYITVQLFDNRMKLYPLICDISHRFNLTRIKSFRPIIPLKISEFE